VRQMARVADREISAAHKALILKSLSWGVTDSNRRPAD
jgi:hypothetical protein